MMLRSSCLFVLAPLGLLAGCASSVRVDMSPVPVQPSVVVVPAPAPDVAVVTDAPALTSVSLSSLRMGAPLPTLDAVDLGTPDPDMGFADLAYKADGKSGKTYTQFKLGAFDGAGDLSDQDTGFWGEVVFGRELISLVAVEASLGYIQSNGPLFDLWAIPLMINGRVQLPLLIFKIYGGVGIGGAYVDASGGGTSQDEFTWLGDAFLGAEIGLGNLAIGLEGRYLKASEKSNFPTLEGGSLFLSLKLPF